MGDAGAGPEELRKWLPVVHAVLGAALGVLLCVGGCSHAYGRYAFPGEAPWWEAHWWKVLPMGALVGAALGPIVGRILSARAQRLADAKAAKFRGRKARRDAADDFPDDF